MAHKTNSCSFNTSSLSTNQESNQSTMRFTIIATTALLLQASTSTEAAKRTTSSAAFLDAFEFGRSNHKAKHPSTIQRKRNGHRALIIHDEDTTGGSSRRHLAAKTSKADDGEESSSSDAKASKKGNYHLFPKAIKESVDADAASYATDVGSIYYVEPDHMAKSAKSAALPKSSKTLRFLTKASKDNLESIYGSSMSYPSFATLGFSMPDDETESGGEGTIATDSPSVTPPPRDPTPNNFHEVIFKYLSACTGVELEWDCLTYTTIEAMMAMAGVDATRSRARFLGTETTNGPTPVFERPTPAPAPQTSTPTLTSTAVSNSTEDQCRPEVNEDDLLSILTTSKQECIDSGTLISDETFQATHAAFTSIFEPTNTCWDTLCNDSDPSSDLFFQILFDQASECAGVELTVEECILDHILEVVFVSNAPDESGTSVRRSLSESCCEPTESDLNFYATYLLLSAEAACAESGSAAITTEEWNKATDDLVKLFGATECWGVDPCDEEDEVVSQELPTPSPTSNSAISGDVAPPFYDGPILSDDGKLCTITPDYDSSAVRSLELSFFYQVETTSESLDLGAIERALIAEVCDAAASERRLQDYETEVVAVEASPEDVISDDCEYHILASYPFFSSAL